MKSQYLYTCRLMQQALLSAGTAQKLHHRPSYSLLKGTEDFGHRAFDFVRAYWDGLGLGPQALGCI